MSVEAVIDRTLTDQRSAGRLIYVFTAALFLATAVVGFGPNSTGILSGRLPIPRPIVHVHAALMLTWLLLLLAQSTLMATGRRQLHQTLGLVSFVLAPAMSIVMIMVSITGYYKLVETGLQPAVVANLLLAQIVAVVQFAAFYVSAALARRNAPETHKRMIVMATLSLLTAATGRMPWLPYNAHMIEDYNYVQFIYVLCLLVPALLNDLLRLGRVHSAYVIGVGVFVSSVIGTMLLWDWPWWQRIAPAWLGVG